MAKYFYVYNIVGVEDSIVKMFNTDTGAMGEKKIKKDRIDDFIDGIKMSGFVLNKELAEADVAEAEFVSWKEATQNIFTVEVPDGN